MLQFSILLIFKIKSEFTWICLIAQFKSFIFSFNTIHMAITSPGFLNTSFWLLTIKGAFSLVFICAKFSIHTRFFGIFSNSIIAFPCFCIIFCIIKKFTLPFITPEWVVGTKWSYWIFEFTIFFIIILIVCLPV